MIKLIDILREIVVNEPLHVKVGKMTQDDWRRSIMDVDNTNAFKKIVSFLNQAGRSSDTYGSEFIMTLPLDKKIEAYKILTQKSTNEIKVEPPLPPIPEGWTEEDVTDTKTYHNDTPVEEYIKQFSAPMEGWDTQHSDYVTIIKIIDKDNPNYGKYIVYLDVAYGGTSRPSANIYNSVPSAMFEAIELMEELMEDWDNSNDDNDIDEIKVNEPLNVKVNKMTQIDWRELVMKEINTNVFKVYGFIRDLNIERAPEDSLSKTIMALHLDQKIEVYKILTNS